MVWLPLDPSAFPTQPLLSDPGELATHIPHPPTRTRKTMGSYLVGQAVLQ